MKTNLKKLEEEAQPSIILVGNANVGKSVIFGNLTGTYVIVSNYPGTTIDVSEGHIAFFDEKENRKLNVRLIDSPGVNSLIPRSEDERVTRNLILEEKPLGVIQVADAKNLKRSLLITTQLAEMNIPIVLVLNIFDEAVERGINIDTKKLSSLLGVPVIASVATEKKGMNELKKSLTAFSVPKGPFKFNQAIEKAVAEIETFLPKEELSISGRSLALMLVAGDKSLLRDLRARYPKCDWKTVEEITEGIKLNFRDPLNFIISRERFVFVNEIYNQCVNAGKKKSDKFRNRIGDIMIHPVYGIPVLLFVLFLLYELVGVAGAGIAVDFFESIIFGKFVNPAISGFLKSMGAPRFLMELLMGEYGLISMGLTYAVAIVFPIVGFFFIFFGILEDSGYLPRLTIMSNRIFKKIGLQGRAVLPMVLGLGCDTMATLTTRILETRRERIIATLLLAVGVPCSAQLGVIMGMLGSMSVKALLIVVVTVIIQLFVVGLLAAKIIPGKSSDFLSEIPPVRIPKIDNIIVKTFHRVVWFMKEAVPLFLLGTFCLFLFAKTGILAMMQDGVKPLLSGLLSLPPETAEAFIVGFLRRDFGAAGLFRLAREGYIDLLQTTVSVTVMVLFVPCVAHLFVMIKELGIKVASAITLFVIIYAVLSGALLNQILRILNVF